MRTFSFAVVLLALGACTSFADHYGMTQEQWKSAVARQDLPVQSCIRERKVRLGMTQEQVVLSWGRPSDVNRTVGSFGVHEQWVYGSPLYGGRYLYFEDGKLTSWQD